jgi:oligopeptide/dipeptide ABC transporter ATP-binding protein
MANRVNVMYAGRLVETARTMPLFKSPLHPYTRGLLDSIPTLTGDPEKRLATIEGQPPDLTDLPPGCAFAERCAHVEKRCRIDDPRLVGVPGVGPGHRSACFEAKSFVPKKLKVT